MVVIMTFVVSAFFIYLTGKGKNEDEWGRGNWGWGVWLL